MPKVFYRGKGCLTCGGTGYRGRLGIFEVLDVTEKIRKLIIDPHFSLDGLRAATREQGMKTMFEDGLDKVELALTSIDEVLRAIRE